MSVKPDSNNLYVGVDVGGTNIKAGIVDEHGRSLAKSSVPTEADRGPDVGIENMATAINLALHQAKLGINDVVGIGLATPGTMDIPSGSLLNPPNLPGWDYFPVQQRLAERMGKRTVLQNDANAAAYGEFFAGAAREARSLVFWTLGTGVGCGIIVNDMIIEGAHSHGAECGHIIIEMTNGRLCDTGQYGTLEAYAGAKGVIRRTQEALDTGKPTTIRDRIANGAELTPLLIAQCADEGDKLADQIVMDTARFLGVGTVTLMHTINPEIVLFGGAMTFGGSKTNLGKRFLEAIQNEVRQRAFPIPAAKTKLDFASLGSDAGYIGAAGCARQRFGVRSE